MCLSRSFLCLLVNATYQRKQSAWLGMGQHHKATSFDAISTVPCAPPPHLAVHPTWSESLPRLHSVPCRLSLSVLRSQPLAFLSALLFCFNPAAAFYSARWGSSCEAPQNWPSAQPGGAPAVRLPQKITKQNKTKQSARWGS